MESKLLDRHEKDLRALIQNLCSADVDDVLQDVKLRVISADDQPEDPGHAFNWLKTITRNCIRDHWRRQQAKSRNANVFSVDNAMQVQDRGRTPSSVAARISETARLRAAIERLDDSEKKVIKQFYLNHESAGSIAQQLGFSAKTVYRILERGKRRLREILRQ